MLLRVTVFDHEVIPNVSEITARLLELGLAGSTQLARVRRLWDEYEAAETIRLARRDARRKKKEAKGRAEGGCDVRVDAERG